MRIRALHSEKGGILAPPETINKYGIKVETRNLDGTVTTNDYSVSETPLDFPREVAQVFLSTFNGLIVEVLEDEIIESSEAGDDASEGPELEPVAVGAPEGEARPVKFRRKRQ